MANWCWGEWGMSFKKLKDKLKKLPFVKPDKLESLYIDIEAQCCIPHDNRFDEWGGIKEYIKANYDFCETLLLLLHWTSVMWRLWVFIFVFMSLNIFGIRYFNWT